MWVDWFTCDFDEYLWHKFNLNTWCPEFKCARGLNAKLLNGDCILTKKLRLKNLSWFFDSDNRTSNLIQNHFNSSQHWDCFLEKKRKEYLGTKKFGESDHSNNTNLTIQLPVNKWTKRTVKRTKLRVILYKNRNCLNLLSMGWSYQWCKWLLSISRFHFHPHTFLVSLFFAGFIWHIIHTKYSLS